MNRRWPEVLGRQLRGQLCDFLWARRLGGGGGKIPAERYGGVNLTETPQEEIEALEGGKASRNHRTRGTGATEDGRGKQSQLSSQGKPQPAIGSGGAIPFL